MPQHATLKKISEQLNLSISTVSRALSDHPDISEKTKQKVKELANLMEYEPNSFAVTLRTNKSHVLGIIVPAISNLFYDSFISSVEKEARLHGYSLLILQSGDSVEQEEENLKLCKHNRVDGLLVCVASDSSSPEYFIKLKVGGMPLVFFDKVPAAGDFDTVCMPDEEAASIAAQAIIKYNKKKILALFGKPDLSITKKRELAFSNTIKSAAKKKAISLDIAHCTSSEEARQLVAARLKGNPRPDHIFCMSDELLVGTMKAIHKTDLKIPGDVSILAISNGFIPSLFNPEITYIETNGGELGKAAIKRLLECLNGATQSQSIIIPARLVAGNSL